VSRMLARDIMNKYVIIIQEDSSIEETARITDAVIEGLNRNKSVTIISEKNDKIAERIMNEIDRGATFLEGHGAYTGEPKRLINCIVGHYEIAKLKEIVLEIDRDAFIFITETVEVMGKGFTRRK